MFEAFWVFLLSMSLLLLIIGARNYTSVLVYWMEIFFISVYLDDVIPFYKFPRVNLFTFSTYESFPSLMNAWSFFTYFTSASFRHLWPIFLIVHCDNCMLSSSLILHKYYFKGYPWKKGNSRDAIHAYSKGQIYYFDLLNLLFSSFFLTDVLILLC